MSFETLQRVAEAAGFAMASDENQLVSDRFKPAPDEAVRGHAPGVLVSNIQIKPAPTTAVAPPAAIWGRAHFGQFMPAWASKG
jgi:hypothetical protein